MGRKMTKILDLIQKFSKNWLGGAKAPPSRWAKEIEKYPFLDQ
jgi:hypothetical protein